MSDHVDVLRRAWAAYADRGIDGAADYYAADATSEDIPELPDGKSYVGPDGFRERYWNFVETWGNFTVVPVEYIDAGDSEVVVVTAMTGNAPESGLPLDSPAVFVYEVRDDEIVRDRVFMSKAEALEAAGLEE